LRFIIYADLGFELEKNQLDTEIEDGVKTAGRKRPFATAIGA